MLTHKFTQVCKILKGLSIIKRTKYEFIAHRDFF